VRRTRPLTVLHTFDAPVMLTNCVQRNSSTVAPQSLLLMNSDFILKQARQFARRLRSQAPGNLVGQITYAWQLSYTRLPTEDELGMARGFVEQRVADLAGRPEDVAEKQRDETEEAEKPEVDDSELLALTSFCQALLSSNEFLYVD